MSDLFSDSAARPGIGGHQAPSRKTKDEWLTPRHILHALGAFDLDPCAPIVRPWDIAARHYTEADNGLNNPWTGRVWCNPPYANYSKWLGRCAEHGNAIALIFARTETEDFFRTVWRRADALLFLHGRLTFHHVDGRKAAANSGAPSVLIAYGANNVESLVRSGIAGAIVESPKIQGGAP